MRLHHLAVAGDGEEQRDVDVDALRQALPDRRNALGGSGNLDHDVGPVAFAPEAPRLGDRARRCRARVRARPRSRRSRRRRFVASKTPRKTSAADRTSRTASASKTCGSVRPGARAADVRVVEIAARDRLLEDRGVRGHARKAVLGDQAREPAAVDQVSADVVVPDALSERRQGLQPIRSVMMPSRFRRGASANGDHVLDREAVLAHHDVARRRGAVAVDADRAAVDRRRTSATPGSTPASIESRAAHRRRQHRRRGTPAAAASKNSQHGIETTRVGMPSASSFWRPATASCSSEPVAMRMTFGAPPDASARTYAPRESVAAARRCDRAPAGSAGRARARSAVAVLHDRLPRLRRLVGVARPDHRHERHRRGATSGARRPGASGRPRRGRSSRASRRRSSAAGSSAASRIAGRM